MNQEVATSILKIPSLRFEYAGDNRSWRFCSETAAAHAAWGASITRICSIQRRSNVKILYLEVSARLFAIAEVAIASRRWTCDRGFLMLRRVRHYIR